MASLGTCGVLWVPVKGWASALSPVAVPGAAAGGSMAFPMGLLGSSSTACGFAGRSGAQQCARRQIPHGDWSTATTHLLRLWKGLEVAAGLGPEGPALVGGLADWAGS